MVAPPSSYAFWITCRPLFKWLLSIATLSRLHLRFSYPSSRVPYSLRPRQYVGYICEDHLILHGTHVQILISCQFHNSDMITGHFLENFINYYGPAHHTLHHQNSAVKYGQVRLVLSQKFQRSDDPMYYSISHELIIWEGHIINPNHQSILCWKRMHWRMSERMLVL